MGDQKQSVSGVEILENLETDWGLEFARRMDSLWACMKVIRAGLPGPGLKASLHHPTQLLRGDF